MQNIHTSSSGANKNAANTAGNRKQRQQRRVGPERQAATSAATSSVTSAAITMSSTAEAGIARAPPESPLHPVTEPPCSSTASMASTNPPSNIASQTVPTSSIIAEQDCQLEEISLSAAVTSCQKRPAKVDDRRGSSDAANSNLLTNENQMTSGGVGQQLMTKNKQKQLIDGQPEVADFQLICNQALEESDDELGIQLLYCP